MVEHTSNQALTRQRPEDEPVSKKLNKSKLDGSEAKRLQQPARLSSFSGAPVKVKERINSTELPSDLPRHTKEQACPHTSYTHNNHKKNILKAN